MTAETENPYIDSYYQGLERWMACIGTDDPKAVGEIKRRFIAAFGLAVQDAQEFAEWIVVDEEWARRPRALDRIDAIALQLRNEVLLSVWVEH